MSNPAPNSTPSSIANSSTPNQVQVLDDGFILKTVKKYDDTAYYNVYFPDGSQFQHMIFGPSDGRVVFDNVGNIRIKAGQKTKERGPGSGKILTHSNGIQCRNEGKGIFTFNANEGEDKVALSVSAYGDYDEETSGQRTINAESILLGFLILQSKQDRTLPSKQGKQVVVLSHLLLVALQLKQIINLIRFLVE